MDFLSVPENVIKNGRLHGHRYGKKPEDKEYCTANQLKKRCKKKYFQRVHDPFIQNPEFRNRMIENHRDQILCRRWDALADEDHAHHLTTQEYSLYKSKWWLHSNKQGSNTTPLTQRPDVQTSIVYLATIETSCRRRPTSAYLLYQKSKMGTEFFFYMVELGKVHGGLLILLKVTMEMHQVLTERGDLLNAVFGKILLDKTFLNSIALLQMDRLQLTAVCCNRRGCKHNTSNDPFSPLQKCAVSGYRQELTITTYSLTTSTKVD